MASQPTALMRSTGTPATRDAEVLTVPITWNIQPLTIYMRFVDMIKFDADSLVPILGLGSAGTRFINIYRIPTGYQMRWQSFLGAFNIVAANASVYGDLVHLCTSLAENGDRSISVLINGTIITTVATSTPIDLDVWSDPKIYIGQDDTTQGGIALNTLMIERGVLSLENMRRLAGT